MRFCDPNKPTEDELLHWAFEKESPEPIQEWPLVLSWVMEPGLLRICIELAADTQCPKAGVFLHILYQWVATVAREDRFEAYRSMYDRWLEIARGVADPGVKRWRHRARLVFQGILPFEYERWWAAWIEEIG